MLTRALEIFDRWDFVYLIFVNFRSWMRLSLCRAFPLEGVCDEYRFLHRKIEWVGKVGWTALNTFDDILSPHAFDHSVVLVCFRFNMRSWSTVSIGRIIQCKYSVRFISASAPFHDRVSAIIYQTCIGTIESTPLAIPHTQSYHVVLCSAIGGRTDWLMRLSAIIV